MIKLVTFLKRGPHLTRPAFGQRWREVHAPLAAQFPNLRGYVLGLSIEDGEPAADGVAQLWFDDRAACQASYASDIGRRGSADAGAHLARRQHLLVSERWRRGDGETTPFKLLIAAKRADGQPRAAFASWWLDRALPSVATDHGASAVRAAADEAGVLLNSGTSGQLGLVAGEAVVDGLLELWFPTAAAALAAAARYRAEDRPRLAREVSATEEAVLHEHVIVAPPAPAAGAKTGSP